LLDLSDHVSEVIKNVVQSILQVRRQSQNFNRTGESIPLRDERGTPSGNGNKSPDRTRHEQEAAKGRTAKQIAATDKWLAAKAANKAAAEGGSSSKSSNIVAKAPYVKKSNLEGKGKTTAAAAAYALGQGSKEPKIINHGRDGVRIVHRELIGSITGSTGFTIAQQIALNPGLQASFPWLSTQAQGWEQYRFHMLRFCYYSRTGSSTPGSMMLVPDYDAADAAPATEQIASAYRDVEEQAPWVPEFCCALNVKAMHPDGTHKFIRTGGSCLRILILRPTM